MVDVPGLVLVTQEARRLVADGRADPGQPTGLPGGPAAVLAVPRPPVGITGGKVTSPPLTVKIDWLNLTFPNAHIEIVRLELNARLGPAELSDNGVRFFRSGSWKWATGASLAWDDQTGRALLSLNGDSLDHMGAETWPSLLRWLHDDVKGKTTRLDVALDLHDRRLQVQHFHDAAQADNFVGFRRWRPVEDFQRVNGRQVRVGYGVYFGKRGKEGSGRYVRVYDKGLETGGDIDATRIEVELSQESAALVGFDLADAETAAHFTRRLCRVITGALDFRLRGDHRHIARMPRLAWWQQLVDALGEGLRMVAQRPVPPLHRAAQWVRDQVGGTLAQLRIVCDSMGFDWLTFFTGIIDAAESRLCWSTVGRRHLGFDPRAILDGR